MRRYLLGFTILGLAALGGTSAAQTGIRIPTWAIGTYDCRVDGALATMTWRLEPRDVIVVVGDGSQTTTERTYYPIGSLQVRGASDFEEMEATTGTDETRFHFVLRSTERSLVRRADGSLRESGGNWNCAAPGQQVPRLRSELDLQEGVILRPQSADPGNLTRR
jgi:hypothetical protein